MVKIAQRPSLRVGHRAGTGGPLFSGGVVADRLGRMFTGLVQAIGTVTAVRPAAGGLRVEVDLGAVGGGAGAAAGAAAGHAAGPGAGAESDPPGLDAAFATPPRLGDSIALSGVCCTVVTVAGSVAGFDLSSETLDRTWLGSVEPGTRLNLEAALRAGQPLGGHLVQGHVDGVGEVVAGIDPEVGGDWRVRVPGELGRYCVEKGSITLDGISLTIAGPPEVTDAGVDVRIAIIPHTAQVTTIGQLPVGAKVNVEVDVLAKYVETMLAARGL